MVLIVIEESLEFIPIWLIPESKILWGKLLEKTMDFVDADDTINHFFLIKYQAGIKQDLIVAIVTDRKKQTHWLSYPHLEMLSLLKIRWIHIYWCYSLESPQIWNAQILYNAWHYHQKKIKVRNLRAKFIYNLHNNIA